MLRPLKIHTKAKITVSAAEMYLLQAGVKAHLKKIKKIKKIVKNA